jgi:hypothetical protein
MFRRPAARLVVVLILCGISALAARYYYQREAQSLRYLEGRALDPSRDSRPTQHTPSDVFDLTRLPADMQKVLGLILLMPLGALVTCFFHTIVGLKTYGTFTPTLLALSFAFSDWKTGLFILVSTLLVGLLTRSFLDRLRLLLLSRLSVLLTLVVCSVVFGASLLNYLDVKWSARMALLPMVIVTMLIERFYVTSQEDGIREALQQLAGTFVVGACCYAVLCWDSVAGWFLAYPELHLFTTAAMVAIGRYTGYQLLELIRFRDVEDFQHKES